MAYIIDRDIDKFSKAGDLSKKDKEMLSNDYSCWHREDIQEGKKKAIRMERQNDKLNGTEVIFKLKKTKQGEDGVVHRFVERVNRHGERVMEYWNSWIRPKNVVRRITTTKGGWVKDAEFYGNGRLKNFRCYESSNPSNERSVAFEMSSEEEIVSYLTTRKGRHYFTEGIENWSEVILSEHTYSVVTSPSFEGRYKMVEKRWGKLKARGWKVVTDTDNSWNRGRKNGEWFEVPFRCRKARPVFYVMDVEVPEKVVKNPELLTVAEVLDEENTEIRRVMMEQMGYEIFLNRCGSDAKLIDKDSDVHVGELWHIKERADTPASKDKVIALLKVKDGTMPKNYVLRVPPTCKTAKAANAWTWGLKADTYAPVIER